MNLSDLNWKLITKYGVSGFIFSFAWLWFAVSVVQAILRILDLSVSLGYGLSRTLSFLPPAIIIGVALFLAYKRAGKRKWLHLFFTLIVAGILWTAALLVFLLPGRLRAY